MDGKGPIEVEDDEGNDSPRRGRQEESQPRIRSRSAPSGHTRMKLRPRHEKFQQDNMDNDD